MTLSMVLSEGPLWGALETSLRDSGEMKVSCFQSVRKPEKSVSVVCNVESMNE